MTIDRRALLELAAGAAALLPAGAHARAAPAGLPAGLPEPDESFELWPNGPPGLPSPPPPEEVFERSPDPNFVDRAVKHVLRPRLSVFRATKPNGAALLVAPGGAYERVVLDKEGYEIGRWLAARGVTVFVLFYRMPGDGWAAGPDVALSDAQRAMRLIRSRASRYGVDPKRVAAMGFSAGGHLCADLLTRFAARTYDPIDEADALSARPMLAAPIYPVVTMSLPVTHAGSRKQLIGEHASPALEAAHSAERNAHKDAPPTFIVHAEDDDVVPVENAVMLRAALRAQGVPVETHLFTEGGHGFGIRRVQGKPAEIWPDLFVNWARSQGLY
jgi:acetyl esterase/lipase